MQFFHKFMMAEHFDDVFLSFGVEEEIIVFVFDFLIEVVWSMALFLGFHASFSCLFCVLFYEFSVHYRYFDEVVHALRLNKVDINIFFILFLQILMMIK